MTVEESDSELVGSYLNGSDAAFERLYSRYKRQLYGYLRSMLPADDADDAFQQAWVRVCAALPGYRDDGKFQAWLFRIGRNQALDALRRRGRRREIESDETEPDVPQETEPWRPIADAELRRQLEDALRQLAPEQQAVFRMRRNEISFKVIADRQGCPVNTAVARMRYALRKLGEILRNGGNER